MDKQEWEIRFDEEIAQAEEARATGNEGKARVCARRAAGIIVGEYLDRRDLSFAGPSAYERLRYLNSLPEIHEQVQKKIEHMLVRVTPEYNLPVDADLIADARWLRNSLLSD